MGKREEKRELVRSEIVAAAGRKMREAGYDGVGVDALAEEAGFTSGAVYTQFGSKKDLLIEVLRDGFASLIADIEERIEKHGDEWYEKRLTHSLSMRHREMVAIGCILPNLSVDAARADMDVREVYENGLRTLIDKFASGLDDGEHEARERAIAAIALMTGGILLARGVASDRTAKEILHTCRKFGP